MTGLVLHPQAAIVRGQGRLLCVGGRAALRFEGDSAELARATVDHLRAGVAIDELRGALAKDAGADVPVALVSELVARLEDAGVLVAAPTARSREPAQSLAGVRVLLCATGAVASAHAPRLVLCLQSRGAVVRVALSAAATRFVAPRALEALTHAPALSQITGGTPEEPAPHITLARWADAVLVAPASATTLSRIATGDCSDLVAAVATATGAPVMLAPSMNARMWGAASTQRNVATLARDGFAVLDPMLGVEVADRPGHRARQIGGALAPEPMVGALEAWLRDAAPELFRRAIDWDDVFRSGGDAAFSTEGLDDEVARALAELAPPPARLIDLGCGTGAHARATAALGYRVVGLDASQVALEAAQARDLGGAVLFVRGDILEPTVRGTFDVLLDRGTLHTLARRDVPAYGARLEALGHEGSVLLVVHDGPKADARAATLRLEPEELARLLGPFELIFARPTELRPGEGPSAVLTALRLSKRG